MDYEGEKMKAIEIAKIFYKLQRSMEGDPNHQGNAGKAVQPPPEEGEEEAPEDLERFQKENQFLVEQLVKASAVIRDLQDKNFESSHKQRVGKVIVSGLLHDLRNPLAVIRSCAQFCLDNADLPPSFREKMEMILESTGKANDLTKKFESVLRGSLVELIDQLGEERLLGEYTVVIKGQ